MRIEDHILLEHKDFLAVNKPAGLLSIAGRDGKEVSLKQILQQHFGEIFTVHRLDKDTSGLIVFARNAAMHKHLSEQFESRATLKVYNGLVLGKPASPEGVINEPIAEHPVKKGMMTVHRKGKESITRYKVLEHYRWHSWMEFIILTGRTHQIRVHMKHSGHPIACDELYGDGKALFLSQLKNNYHLSKKEDSERPLLQRLALHAAQLHFTGAGGEPWKLEAPLPKDLRAIVNQLRKTV
ncbi:MAG: RluA family pseudouridine synthase [Flavisolibacter sp.]